MEQELLTLPEHLSSPPVFGGVRVAGSLVSRVMFCISLFVLFLLAVVLSVLRFTTPDYPLVSTNFSITTRQGNIVMDMVRKLHPTVRSLTF